MRRRGFVGLIVVVATVLTACGSAGGASTQTSRQTAVMRIAIGADADTLDPMRQTTLLVQNLVGMVVESLTTIDTNGKIQPSLATGWQESADAMSWAFTLRTGVEFSDGTAFDAAAVKANLDRISDPKSTCPQCGALGKSLRSVDVLDPAHVRLNMSQPLAGDVVIGLLSTVTYGMLSPRTIQPGTANYARQEKPVSTGPYVLKEHVVGDHLTLVRNEAYWGRRPIYASQVFQVVPNDATREALVRSGQAEMIILPPISDLPSLRQDPTVTVLLGPSDRSIYVAIDTLDTRQPLLQNPQVRQALNYAVNRDAIVKSTLFGAAVPATSTVAPNLFGYCMVPNQYTYDPDLARSMLQKANASGLTVTMIAPTGRYMQDFQAAQNIANDLRVVGVNVIGPSTMDWPSYVARINVPPAMASVDLHMLGYAPGFLDASQAMQNTFDAAAFTPRGLNSPYYSNPDVTALLQKASTEPNREARAQEYCDAEKQVWSDAPWIFLWVQKNPIVFSAQVTGITALPNEMFDTVYAQPI